MISTVLEHNSVLRPLYEMEKKGVEVTFLGCDEKGTLDYADFDKAIKENTKAIVCTHGSNLTGNKVDVERIGEIAKKTRSVVCGRCITDCRCISDRCAEDAY